MYIDEYDNESLIKPKKKIFYDNDSNKLGKKMKENFKLFQLNYSNNI